MPKPELSEARFKSCEQWLDFDGSDSRTRRQSERDLETFRALRQFYEQNAGIVKAAERWHADWGGTRPTPESRGYALFNAIEKKGNADE